MSVRVRFRHLDGPDRDRLDEVWLPALIGSAALAEEPAVLHEGIAHDALYDLCFDARGGIAVGAGGVVLASDGTGGAWQPQVQSDCPASHPHLGRAAHLDPAEAGKHHPGRFKRILQDSQPG